MAIQFKETPLPGCFEFLSEPARDARGSFLKLFQDSIFRNRLGGFSMKECFVSTSSRGVVRGFHFQAPPHDHDKVVVCLQGRVFDVAFDMRKSRETFGKSFSSELDSKQGNGLFIPRGCAHGFQALEDGSTLLYFTTAEHAPASDLGFRWDSIEVRWPLRDVLVSDRDRALPAWSDYRSPFS